MQKLYFRHSSVSNADVDGAGDLQQGQHWKFKFKLKIAFKRQQFSY